ncbi:hypothetical protein ACJJTC_009181 [Scirpophaga incertulas]
MEKKKMAKERQDKNNRKEKNMAKKKLHSKSKIKTYNQEDSSSEDTDTDFVYTESDDSIENIDQNVLQKSLNLIAARSTAESLDKIDCSDVGGEDGVKDRGSLTDEAQSSAFDRIGEFSECDVFPIF